MNKYEYVKEDGFFAENDRIYLRIIDSDDKDDYMKLAIETTEFIVDADIPMKGGDVFYIEAESYMRIAKMILEARREILAMFR